MRTARLPLVSVQNAAGRFTQPDPAHFSLALPRNAALPDATGDAWNALNVSASGADPALGGACAESATAVEGFWMIRDAVGDVKCYEEGMSALRALHCLT